MLAEKFKAKGKVLIERDLNKNMAFISESSLAAVGTPIDGRSEEQVKNQTAHLADILIKEFRMRIQLLLARLSTILDHQPLSRPGLI